MGKKQRALQARLKALEHENDTLSSKVKKVEALFNSDLLEQLIGLRYCGQCGNEIAFIAQNDEITSAIKEIRREKQEKQLREKVNKMEKTLLTKMKVFHLRNVEYSGNFGASLNIVGRTVLRKDEISYHWFGETKKGWWDYIAIEGKRVLLDDYGYLKTSSNMNDSEIRCYRTVDYDQLTQKERFELLETAIYLVDFMLKHTEGHVFYDLRKSTIASLKEGKKNV